MKYFFLTIGLLWANRASNAQELNFSVKVNTQKLQLTDPQIFNTLQQTLEEFINNTKWTNDYFEPEESIQGNVLLTIQEELPPEDGGRNNIQYRADLAIQAVRPVYNSDYETVTINHIDRNVQFTYEQFQPLQYSQSVYNDNLSSIISFYIHVILGLDYDSFSLYGGEPYLQRAQEILNTVPQSVAAGAGGWTAAQSDRNRFWIIENLLSPRVRPLREALYKYHRQALDIMADDTAAGRAIIAESLRDIEKVHAAYPNTMIVQMFSNAKGAEIVEIFKRGSRQEKQDVIRIMSRVDPARSDDYRAIQ